MLLKSNKRKRSEGIGPIIIPFAFQLKNLKNYLRLRFLVFCFIINSFHNGLLAWTCTTQQLNTVPCYATNQNQEIVALVLTTAVTAANATSFSFNTTGCTSPLTTISNAKLWYSNSCPVIFANCASADPVQFGATVAAPNGVFSFAGSVALTAGCVYYFFLTYDIKATAPVGSIVDAQCTSVTYGTVQAPIITAPAGSRTINAPLPPANLVPDPSFEGICPYTTGCSVLANGISEVGIAYPWYCPTSGTSDYQNCGTGAPGAFVPIPPPRTGNCTVGEYFYGFGGYREYVQVPLSRPLIAGNCYELVYFVRLSTSQAGCQVKDMSGYFSTGPVFNYGSTTNIPVLAQVTATALTGNATSWSQVCGCFTAVGGENYLTIGNFKTDALTTQVGCTFGYFFVDDVSVQDMTQTGAPSTCGSCACAVALPIELLFF